MIFQQARLDKVTANDLTFLSFLNAIFFCFLRFFCVQKFGGKPYPVQIHFSEE